MLYSQRKYLIPRGRKGFVLRVCLQSRVDQLEDAKRVGLAAQVGRRQPLGPVHAYREDADVAEIAKRPGDRVLFPDVFLFCDFLLVSGQVRDCIDRGRAADRQQKVQHANAAATSTGCSAMISRTFVAVAATAVIVITVTDDYFVFNLVSGFPF